MKFLIPISLLVILFAPPANAHRGNLFSDTLIENNSSILDAGPDARVPHPVLNRFPGFFDTYTAPKNKFVFEVPSMSFDYGLTESLTLGTNLFATSYLIRASHPILQLKARYRVFSTRFSTSTLTGYFGGFSAGGPDELHLDPTQRIGHQLSSGIWTAATSNTVFYLDSDYRNALSFNLIGGYFLRRYQEGDNSEWGTDLSTSLKVIAPGIGYHFFPYPEISLDFQIGFPFWFGYAETAASIEMLQINPGLISTTPYRLTVNYNLTSDSVFTFGVIMGSILPLPYGVSPSKGMIDKKYAKIPVFPVLAWSIVL